MPRVLFAHRDFAYFVPKLRETFPTLDILTAMDLPEADDRLADAEVIVAAGHRFNDERLTRAASLEWIHAMTTGTDAIVGARALKPEVVVTNTRGIHGPQTSEMAFMYMLNLARRYRGMLENQKQHVWQRWDQVRLYGKTVAILGVGLISEALALRCKAFGMTVLGITRTPRVVAGFDRLYTYGELHAAAALADFLVVLAPNSPETENMIDAKLLAAMKPTAFLINLARGALCDEEALLDALREKRIAGAGLDVFRTEPLPKESPFWDLDNVMITAHCSGSSDDNLALTWPIIETNMKCYLEGRASEMINVVPH
jgi:phosphoglycerate dehydrogenase-like enzyme